MLGGESIPKMVQALVYQYIWYLLVR